MKFSKLARIYTNLKINQNQTITLDGNIFHYCKSVLRMKLSEEFRLFNELDGEFLVQITELNKRDLKIIVLNQLRKTQSETHLTLALAIIKPDRFIEAIKAATQLGATKIIPIICQRTQYKSINHEKFLKCILESTEQSERLIPPILNKPIKLEEFSKIPDIGQIIFANENEESLKISSIKEFKDSVTVLIGPEGGFSDHEQKLLLQNEKIISVTLGKTVLRSEVAVSSAIACVNLIRG